MRLDGFFLAMTTIYTIIALAVGFTRRRKCVVLPFSLISGTLPAASAPPPLNWPENECKPFLFNSTMQIVCVFGCGSSKPSILYLSK